MVHRVAKGKTVPFSLHSVLTQECYQDLAAQFIHSRESHPFSCVFLSSCTPYDAYRFSRYFSQIAPHAQELGIVPFSLPSAASLILYTPQQHISAPCLENIHPIDLSYFKTHERYLTERSLRAAIDKSFLPSSSRSCPLPSILPLMRQPLQQRIQTFAAVP